MSAEDFRIEKGIYYTKDHLWVKLEKEDDAVVGITDYGQHQLGDVVYVELPQIGTKVEAGEKVASVESVKAAVDVLSPLTGEIIAVNEDLKEEPDLVNTDPYGDGWIFEIKLEDTGEIEDLMTSEDYKAYLEEIEEESQ
ncbi:glycine cleavage system protein GcvH [Hydrogenivirga sp. 128-5-R1-1]|uniref:glycine cleavage system protein GcvH n=1 Tax=Hydrogenivirga sp. 128-5-R1-1 TaxID=392423 RepID=UPI00015F283A|nr:glycine cleavage system protein GcvH [Hydrogenivirga sp. 128-5-R1-1]EDP73642.1 glycine cleavage system protein H [Hydrogenivirga sp. 128-5-R1-1]